MGASRTTPVDLSARGERRGGVRARRAEIGGEREAPLDQRSRSASSSAARRSRKSAPRRRARAQARSSRRRASARSKICGGGGERRHRRPYATTRPSRAKPGCALTSGPWMRISPSRTRPTRRARPARRAPICALRLAKAALDTLYPPTCLACRAATEAHGALCPRCWRAMRFIERPFCERLGTPFEQDLGDGLLSPQAMADPPVFARARAVARFEDGPARKLVHRLKYSDRAELARPMARWMARAGADILADADLPRARAAASAEAVAAALQPGGHARAGSRARDRQALRRRRAPPRQGDRAARSA